MRTSTAGGLSLYYLGDTLICTLWGLMQLLLKCILFKIKNNAKHVNATLLILQPKKKLMNQCVNFPYIIVFRSIWSTQNESFLLVWVLTTTSSTVGSLPNSAAFHKHKTKTNFSFVPNTSYIQNSSFSKTIDLFICVEFIYMINSSIL
jgi:hypothetical protein